MKSQEKKWDRLLKHEDMLTIGLIGLIFIILLVLWGLESSPSFVPDTLANLVSDITAGVIIATIVGLWLNKREQQAEQLISQKHYLHSLKTEITENLKGIPEVEELFKKQSWGAYFKLFTPFWDSIKTSGDLPKLLGYNTTLLEKIGAFYAGIDYARQGRDLMMQSWLVSGHIIENLDKKQEMYTKMVVSGLNKSLDSGEKAIEEIDRVLLNMPN